MLDWVYYKKPEKLEPEHVQFGDQKESIYTPEV